VPAAALGQDRGASDCLVVAEPKWSSPTALLLDLRKAYPVETRSSWEGEGRVYIPDFRYHQPSTVGEACRILDASQDAALLAGGTDLLVELKQGKRRSRDVVSLTKIRELQSISVEGETLSIGAVVTQNQLIASPLVREHCPALGEAAAAIATEQIRNTATIGGNLCTAASCADSAPILIALDAEIELAGNRGERCLPLQEFFIGHRATVLEKGEILTRVLVPMPAPGTGAAYEKFGLRGSASVAVASVAVRVGLEKGICRRACFVMGAVAPTPKISRGAAELVEGRAASELAANEVLLETVGRVAAADAEPIDDLRGSGAYRRALVAVLARRALLDALGRCEES
jgi:CO/xanthine dehydrogenase FAD-binding subunit